MDAPVASMAPGAFHPPGVLLTEDDPPEGSDDETDGVDVYGPASEEATFEARWHAERERHAGEDDGHRPHSWHVADTGWLARHTHVYLKFLQRREAAENILNEAVAAARCAVETALDPEAMAENVAKQEEVEPYCATPLSSPALC